MKVTKDNPCRCELRSFLSDCFLHTRKDLNLTQMEFAFDLGIDRRSYLDIEHKKYNVLRHYSAGLPLLFL